ncbi:Fe(3+)-hydroxamate ABC transporter permease FhuB [Sinorhizobium sp. BG8]|uniref:Fe(3+)-hydroxamate ABC transporter permease FhuB n=1 Tax=Sinorhizobium sp. BG8 TaxID=2613773 RepID=UPI00193EA6DF|nr:Fe(3+)-hydroxamate ABC transporter permease FhuB [Sinorhizobium sp. BG8]QRM54108.1 Fe(3+)-hydroxamate ABC transporter permease FhuB [Sinorhizobium sp. BG8]
MISARSPAFGAALVCFVMFAAATVMFGLRAGPELSRLAETAVGYDPARMTLLYAVLPRLVTALLCGAALALSGTLFQQVLLNPLASPTTLGISSGASLALAIAGLLMPGLIGVGRDLVALGGSAIVAGLVFFLGARRGFSPFSLVLSGMVISLWCGALSAILVLMNERYLVSLFIWGSGSLSQQSWQIVFSLLPRLAILFVAAALLVRPLAMLDLGETSASSIGVSVGTLRVAAVGVAVALAAFVTSAVGVIGFVGLIAPILARLLGARTLRQQLLWSPLLGAALLFLTDEAVQWLAGAMSEFLPTGAVTAIFGSPLLLLLLPRLKTRHRVMPRPPLQNRFGRPGRREALLFVGLLLPVLLIAALFVGRSPTGGFALLPFSEWQTILPFRFPRVLAALAAGTMLAVSGTLLQRLTGNEMASPEVVGISAGATLGVAVALFVTVAPGQGFLAVSAAGGALVVLLAIFALGLKSGMAPERVLLVGIALGAMTDALTGILGATGDPRALILMRWMSGSTYGIDTTTAMALVLATACLVPLAAAAWRWLDLLPLGPVPAASVGVPVRLARSALFLLSALLAAVATIAAGPVSFAGLMAPHLARELGFHRALPQLVVAAACGGALLVIADWLGRMLFFPYQISAGLVSALVGAPFLMLLLRRRG